MLEGSPVPRAHRYPIEAPILYRRAESGEWLEGKTVNISTSGIRFLAPQLLDPDSQIEMDLVFQPGSDTSPPVHLLCKGRVVATRPPDEPGQFSAISAQIRSYNFLRPEPGPVDPLAGFPR